MPFKTHNQVGPEPQMYQILELPIVSAWFRFHFGPSSQSGTNIGDIILRDIQTSLWDIAPVWFLVKV